MLRLALRELRNAPTRMAAVLGAITISVGFLAACLTFLETEKAAVAAATTESISTSDVVIDLGEPDPRLLDVIRKTSEVAVAEPQWTGGLSFRGPDGAGFLHLTSLPADPSLSWAPLVDGDWPQRPDQLAIGQSTARQHGLAVGSVITGDDPAAPDRLTVTGIVDQSRSLFSGIGDSGFAAADYFTAQPDNPPMRYLIKITPGADVDRVITGLRAVLPDSAQVATAEQVAEQTLLGLSGGVDTYGILLQGFGAVALLVGGIMIANTFAILVAQRRRQIGLLRAVGATGGEVRRMVLAEALLVGVAGAAAGIALGLGLATIGAAVSGSISNGLVPPWGRLALAALVGVAVTVAAAAVPAARTTRISPLEALRPVDDHRVERRRSVIGLGLALLLALAGAAVIGVAFARPGNVILPAIAGAIALGVGVIAAAPVYVPALARLGGMLLRRFGPVSRVAAANSLRHPGRAAATSAALMIAVGLVVTLQVGAASVKATTDVDTQQRYPVDVTVSSSTDPLPREVIDAVAAVPGIGAVSEVRQTRGALTDLEEIEVTVAGLPADADRVVRGGLDRLDGDDVALIGDYTARTLGLAEGQRVTVRVGERETDYTLRISRIPDDFTLVVRDSALTALDPRAPLTTVWATATDRSEAQSVSAGVLAAVDQRPGIEIGGSLSRAAELGQLIDALLTGATALLGVAIVIALIGVGNTLGLSVVERQRESALLRALGLERRQLRRMLAIEAVLLAVIATVVGIAAGIGFGYLGTAALAADAGLGAPVLAVSGSQLAMVVVVALLAGAAASVLPGIRAAKVPPAAALAQAS